MRRPALRAAARIARRDARRAPGRSILVMAMIALPVFALSTADVLGRTAQLSPTEEVAKQMGAADAVLTWADGPIVQSPDGKEYGIANPGAEPKEFNPPEPTTSDVARLLPAGTHIVDLGSVRAAFRTKAGVKLADLIAFDYAAAPVRGLIRQVTGRPPRTGEEVALSRPLATAIGVRLGDSVHLTRPAKKTFRVVGIAEDPYDLKAENAYTLPLRQTAGSESRPGPGDPRPKKWFVATPGPMDWQQVMALNAKGYVVTSRAVLLRQPPRSQVPYYTQQAQMAPVSTLPVETGAVIALAVGMALLEVVLLAGPAFAVGARRRRRELALVAATGGERRDIRNIVLAGGAVLGLIGAVVGIAAGIGLAAALLPILEPLVGSVSGHFDLRPLELSGLALLGVVTGLAAAYLPARAAARQDVVAALAGRRGIVRTRARVPLLGLVLALAGMAIAVGGAALMRSVPTVLGGAIIAEIGLIVCTPALLGLAGRLGRRLPLSPRMALRDAARNRSAVTPAVAAVMAAVAGSVGIGIFVTSLSARDEAAYQPQLAHSDAVVQLDSSTGTSAPQVADALRRTLPARRVAVLYGQPPACSHRPSKDCLSIFVELPAHRACPLWALRTPSPADVRRYEKDPRCTRTVTVSGGGTWSNLMIDDGTALPMVTGTSGTEAAAALRAGKVVVADPWAVENGKATLRIQASGADFGEGKLVKVPAVTLGRSGLTSGVHLVVPPAMASHLGLRTSATAVYADNQRLPTDREQQAAQGALEQMGIDSFYVERGYVDRYFIGLLGLVIAAAIITLGAAAIATALSNVDGRQDLVTLAAVGASPRVRRVLSMSRAGVIAVLGTALGAIAGFVPPVGLILTLRAVETEGAAWPLVVPWSSLAVTALVVPAIAVTVAGLFSRSRLPVERRAAT